MTNVLSSIESEYRRYKALGEGAFEQASDEDLSRPGPGGGNSLAIVVWHVSGNLKSRFTEFLTSDGEKPWRNRESEFDSRTVSQRELLDKWEDGWSVLFAALAGLKDDDLPREVAIRGVAHTVAQALHRSLAHTAYHVGQIVYLAKALRGDAWRSLSIPRPPR